MKGYKGFDKNMQCRGFQFEEGKTYKTDKAEICESGFHFCLNPLDCIKYYDMANDNQYAEVEALAKCKGHSDDSKQCTTKIKIGKKLTLAEFIKASVDFLYSSIKKDDGEIASGESSAQAASGYYSTQAASGYSSTQAASGNYSTQAASGNYSTQVASGNYSTQAASGNYSTIDSTGEFCVMAAIGSGCKIKGKIDSWITLAEWKDGNPVTVKSIKIDGKKIKADTFYTLKRGKFIQVK
jgi:hypothetical protein